MNPIQALITAPAQPLAPAQPVDEDDDPEQMLLPVPALDDLFPAPVVVRLEAPKPSIVVEDEEDVEEKIVYRPDDSDEVAKPVQEEFGYEMTAAQRLWAKYCVEAERNFRAAADNDPKFRAMHEQMLAKLEAQHVPEEEMEIPLGASEFTITRVTPLIQVVEDYQPRQEPTRMVIQSFNAPAPQTWSNMLSGAIWDELALPALLGWLPGALFAACPSLPSC